MVGVKGRSGRKPSEKTIMQRRQGNNSQSSQDSFELPNTSGDHLRGIKRQAPVQNYDLVNKEYVDTNDPIHWHSKLVASDGSPNPAFDIHTSGMARASYGLGINAVTQAGMDAGNLDVWTDQRWRNAAGTSVGYFDTENVKLGIGTASPSSLLHLKGSNGITQERATTGTFYNAYVTGSSGTNQFALDVNSDNTALGTYGSSTWHSNQLVLKNDGNVGIGTTAPYSSLSVSGTTGGNPDIEGVHIGLATNSAQIQLTGTHATYPNIIDFSNAVSEDADFRIAYRNSPTGLAIGAGTTPTGIFIDTSGNVGIGTTSPATSAKLEISSTTGALLLPRMTTTQRNALTAVNGMVIYNTTTNAFNFYENGAWVTGSGLT